MPKTYTSDILEALPSSVEGPFKVVDAADSTSWIKIDPAGSQIAISGDARPTRVLTISFLRPYGTTATQWIGSSLAARFSVSTTDGGMYLTPFPVPADMDISEPSSVRVLASPLLSATDNGQVARLHASWSAVADGGSVSGSTVTLDWNVPDDWSTSDHNLILLDNGNGRTCEGGTFAHGEIIGFRFIRLGSNAADTFNKSIKVAESMFFEYTAKQFS